MVNEFEKLYIEDQKHTRIWNKKYSDEEYYKINKNLRKRLEILIKKKKLTPKEHFISAMIFHHGFKMGCSKKAISHIRKAQALGYKKQRWLIASIKDRLLQLKGKPQKYGTQITKKNGKIRQYKTDNSISDKERKELGLPSFKKLKKYIES